MSQRKHPKYEYLTSRWGGMKLREEFGERIDNWLKAFDESEHQLLLSLLSQFYYYSEEKIKSKVKELYEKFLATKSEATESIVFTKIIKELGTSYSDILFNIFWLCNGLYDFCEPQILSLLDGIDECQTPDIICIIDDYSGSGKTFVKTIDKLIEANQHIAQAHIFFLVLHITHTAVSLIQEYSKSTGIKIDVVYLDLSDKTFKEDYLYSQVEARRHRLQYQELCAKNKTNADFVFGYEAIESLVAFHYNTPNNTLGLFWQDFTDFLALFPRHKKQKTTLSQLQKNARKRKSAKETKAIFGIGDTQYALFMAYCVAQNSKFSFDQARSDFGLSTPQLTELIDRMIGEEYIVVQDGAFVATAKLKSHMFTSRLKKLKKTYTDNVLGLEESPDFKAIPYLPKKF